MNVLPCFFPGQQMCLEAANATWPKPVQGTICQLSLNQHTANWIWMHSRGVGQAQWGNSYGLSSPEALWSSLQGKASPVTKQHPRVRKPMSAPLKPSHPTWRIPVASPSLDVPSVRGHSRKWRSCSVGQEDSFESPLKSWKILRFKSS